MIINPRALIERNYIVAAQANDLEVVERVYVVGTLGGTVPENNSFSVIPTFVVRQAWPVHIITQ